MKPYNTHHIPLSLDGRGPKPVPVPDTGARVKNDAPHRDVIADLIRNPEGQGRVARVKQDNTNTRPVIADLIRPFIGTRTIRRLRLCAESAHAGTA